MTTDFVPTNYIRFGKKSSYTHVANASDKRVTNLFAPRGMARHLKLRSVHVPNLTLRREL